jgi:hypothetical protein
MKTPESTTTPETTTPAAAPTAPKTAKSYSVRLVSGNADVVSIAYAVKGGFRVEAIHSVPDGKTKLPSGKVRQREYEHGASQIVATLDAARAAVDKLAASFVKLGWTRPAGRRSFERKADAFGINNLPKPPKK